MVKSSETTTVLPDVLQPRLRVVFCGTGVGAMSAQVGAYYAGHGNQFWKVLFQISLTPRRLDPHEFRTLPTYGLGLTDLVKTRSGFDKAISSSDFDILGFCSKIKGFSPKVVAFNGKAAARAFFGYSVGYGGPKCDSRIGETVIFVLPSTTAAAGRFWEESHWRELADFVDGRRQTNQS